MTQRIAFDFIIHQREAKALAERSSATVDREFPDDPQFGANAGATLRVRALLYGDALATYVHGVDVFGSLAWQELGGVNGRGVPFHGITVWPSTVVAMLLRRLRDLASGKVTATAVAEDIEIVDIDMPPEATEQDRQRDLDLTEVATTARTSRARAAILIEQIVALNRKVAQDYQFNAHRDIAPLREQLRDCDLSPAELAEILDGRAHSDASQMRRLAREVKRWRELVAPDAPDPRDPHGYDDARHG